MEEITASTSAAYEPDVQGAEAATATERTDAGSNAPPAPKNKGGRPKGSGKGHGHGKQAATAPPAAAAHQSQPQVPQVQVPPPNKNAPLLAALDPFIAFIGRYSSNIVADLDEPMQSYGARRCGLMNAEAFAQATAMDLAVGKLLKVHGAPAEMLPDRPQAPEGGGERPVHLPHTRLCYRHSPEYKRRVAPVEVVNARPGNGPGSEKRETELATPPNDYLPPRWWLIGVDAWLGQMEAFREQVEALGRVG